MIYFKSVQLPGDEKQMLEKAIRRVALRRTRSLDLTPAVNDMGAEKLFLGLDDKQDVKFTRLRTSFEKFFPKIIVSFPRDEASSEYRLRLSLLSTCVFVLLAIGLFTTIIIAVIDHYDYESIAGPLLFLCVFILLVWLELKIVDRKLRKALNRYRKESGVVS